MKFIFAVIAIILVTLLVLLFFFNGWKVLSNLLFKGLDYIGPAGTCSLNLGDRCAAAQSEEACVALKDDKEENECSWCVGFVNGQQLSSCGKKVCGCGKLFPQRGITVDVLGDSLFDDGRYSVGGSMVIKGKVSRVFFDQTGQPLPDVTDDKTDLEVKLRFLDGSRKETDRLGENLIVKTEKDGSFSLSYTVPETATPGRYFVVAVFSDVSDSEDFEIVAEA